MEHDGGNFQYLGPIHSFSPDREHCAAQKTDMPVFYDGINKAVVTERESADGSPDELDAEKKQIFKLKSS